MSRATLFCCGLVAVVAIAIWHIGSSVPIGGTYFLPKFFFSTPTDVALRVWTLFADGAVKIATCTEPIDPTRMLNISEPCFGKTVYQHLLITLTEGLLAFFIVAAAACDRLLLRATLCVDIFDPYIRAELPAALCSGLSSFWAVARPLVEGGLGSRGFSSFFHVYRAER